MMRFNFHIRMAVIFSLFSGFSLGWAQEGGAPRLLSSGRGGGSHVFSAEPHLKQTFGFGFQKEYFQSDTVPFSNRNNVHATEIFLNYAPTPFLQIFANKKSFTTHNKTYFPTLTAHAFHKTELGTFFTLGLSRHLFMGIEPSYTFYNGNGIEMFEAYGYGFRWLNTYKIFVSQKKYPIKIHFNTQYVIDKTKKLIKKFDFSSIGQSQLYGLSNFNSIRYGLGVEFQMSSIIPYVEYSLDQMLKAHTSFFRNPNRLTAAFKFLPVKNSDVMIHLGTNFGLTDKQYRNVSLTPRYNFFAGISYTKQGEQKESQTIINHGPVSEEEKATPETTVTEKVSENMAYPIYPPIYSNDEEKTAHNENGVFLSVSPLSETEMKKYPISLIIMMNQKPIAKKPVENKLTPTQTQNKSQKTIPVISESLKTDKQIEKQVVTDQKPKSEPQSRMKSQAPLSMPKVTTSVESFHQETSPFQEGASQKNFSEEAPNKEFLKHFK